MITLLNPPARSAIYTRFSTKNSSNKTLLLRKSGPRHSDKSASRIGRSHSSVSRSVKSKYNANEVWLLKFPETKRITSIFSPGFNNSDIEMRK